MIPALISLALLGCRAEGDVYGGTSVGNPGSMSARLAPAPGVSTAQASLPLGDLVLDPCDGANATRQPINRVLLTGIAPVLDIPGGDWCAVRFETTGPVQLDLGLPDGSTWSAAIDGVTVDLQGTAGLHIDGQRFVLELASPDWVDGKALVGSAAPEPGDALYQALLVSLSQASALFLDDGDGEVEDEERGEGPELEGEDHEDDDDDDGGDDDDDSGDDGGSDEEAEGQRPGDSDSTGRDCGDEHC